MIDCNARNPIETKADPIGVRYLLAPFLIKEWALFFISPRVRDHNFNIPGFKSSQVNTLPGPASNAFSHYPFLFFFVGGGGVLVVLALCKSH